MRYAAKSAQINFIWRWEKGKKRENKARTRRIGFSLEGFYGGPAKFRRALEHIREAGYADRHPTQRGQTSLTAADYDDGLAAFAVPLRKGARVWGAMNLLWNRDAATVDEMAAQYLPRLQDTAAAIMEGVE